MCVCVYEDNVASSGRQGRTESKLNSTCTMAKEINFFVSIFRYGDFEILQFNRETDLYAWNSVEDRVNNEMLFLISI